MRGDGMSTKNLSPPSIGLSGIVISVSYQNLIL